MTNVKKIKVYIENLQNGIEVSYKLLNNILNKEDKIFGEFIIIETRGETKLN